MEESFIREYELSVSIPDDNEGITDDILTPFFIGKSAPFKVNSNPNYDSGYKDFRNKAKYFKTFTDLNITASIKYSSSKTSDGSQTSKIKVYNMSPANIAWMRKSASIVLKAGYKQDKNLPIVFNGQVDSVFTEKSGENIITTFMCSDSGLPLRNIRASLSYEREVGYWTIINALLSKLAEGGVPLGAFDTAEQPVSLTGNARAGIKDTIGGGYNVEGNVFEELTRVCDSLAYRAYIVLGKVYVEPKAKPTRIGLVAKVYQHNVKGTIKSKLGRSAKGIKSKENDSGITINTFLDGRITANTTLEVMYGRHAGRYTVRDVEHSLDYEGGKWDTITSCTQVEG